MQDLVEVVQTVVTEPTVLADDRLLPEWLRQCDLTEVPLVLRALAERPPRSRADLTMRVPDGPVAMRTWLRTGFGWVSVALSGDRAAIRAATVTAAVGALLESLEAH